MGTGANAQRLILSHRHLDQFVVGGEVFVERFGGGPFQSLQFGFSSQYQPSGVSPGYASSRTRRNVVLASSSICFVSRTAADDGSRTASRRRKTHIGKITSGYLPRLNRSRRTSS